MAAVSGKISEATARRLADVTKRVLGAPVRTNTVGAQSRPDRAPLGILVCRLTADIARRSSGDVEILSGDQGAETPTGIIIRAYNRFGDLTHDTSDDTKNQILVDRVGQKYEILQANMC